MAVVGGVALLLVAHVGLLVTRDLSSNLGMTAVLVVVSILALVWVGRAEGGPSLRTIILVAAALRLLLLPLPPSLSGDAFRYLWDGKVASAGSNPYELSPDAPELVHLRDEDWNRLPHRDVPTVYPPLAVTLFSIVARAPSPLLFWKLIVIGADLATCWLLCGMAQRRFGSNRGVHWYAWNPVATIEFAGMGHVDALAILALVAALWALTVERRTLTAAMAGAASILAKLVPLVCVPVWARHSKRPFALIGLVGLVVGLAYAPVVWASKGVPAGYLRFGMSWEFNGPLYEPTWRALDRLEISRRIETALDRQKERTGDHEFWNRFYPYNYPQLHARLLLLPLLLLFVIRAWRRQDPLWSTGLALEAVLLFSATVYPWYTIWLLPFAALLGYVPWLVLVSLNPLSYAPQFTDQALFPWIFLLSWLPFAWTRFSYRATS